MTEEEFRAEMPITEARPGIGRMSANEALVRRVLEAVTRGDLETLSRSLDDQVVWHVPGHHPGAGDHRGREAVLAFHHAVLEATEGSLRLELLAAFGDDDYGVLFVRATAARQGKHLDQKEVLVFAICNDLITEVWHRPDPDRLEAFFA